MAGITEAVQRRGCEGIQPHHRESGRRSADGDEGRSRAEEGTMISTDSTWTLRGCGRERVAGESG